MIIDQELKIVDIIETRTVELKLYNGLNVIWDNIWEHSLNLWVRKEL